MIIVDGYNQLNKIVQGWHGEVCIFGAGKIGTGYGYHLIVSFGANIDFYLDNKIDEGQIIYKGIRTRSIEYLYRNKDHVLVFVCVGAKNRHVIEQQLLEHGVENYVSINDIVLAGVLEDVYKSKDKKLNEAFGKLLDNKSYLEMRYKQITGLDLNIINPETFNEKLQWLKIYDYHPEYCRFVDKLAMKDYVSRKIGQEYVIPLLGAWDSYKEINYADLPNKLVLKCTHDSGSIQMVMEKNGIDHDELDTYFSKALKINYYWIGREWPYRDVPRKIIAEEYIEDEYGELRDYKLFCFGGKVKMIQVDFDRFRGHKRNLFDTEWNYIPLSIEFPTAPEVIIERPKRLEEMIEIAELLSVGMIHVRIDFYVVRNQPIVGEMTFFHGGGMEKFTPNEWNYRLGELIRLPI